VERLTLTFHGAGPPPRVLEADEAAVWVDAETVATVLDAVAQRSGTVITVDDGNASDASVILPALLERGLRATFFVVAGRLGEREFLGREDLRALARAGMEIGSHGMRHRPWRGLGPSDLDDELVRARAVIEEAAGAPVRAAACPFGAYDRRVLSALRRVGYDRVYTSDGGLAGRDDWIQARTTVRHGDGGDLIAAVARRRRGPWSCLPRAKRMIKRWR
jgi:peptidoglycan/xylan/chitin deacetylase (PgdA/CDA1 family)